MVPEPLHLPQLRVASITSNLIHAFVPSNTIEHLQISVHLIHAHSLGNVSQAFQSNPTSITTLGMTLLEVDPSLIQETMEMIACIVGHLPRLVSLNLNPVTPRNATVRPIVFSLIPC